MGRWWAVQAWKRPILGLSSRRCNERFERLGRCKHRLHDFHGGLGGGFAGKQLFAAAAAVLILLSKPVFNLIQSNSAELDSATYEDHFVYHSEIDAYELINDLDGKDLDTLKSQLIVQDETLETILATSPTIEILLSE